MTVTSAELEFQNWLIQVRPRLVRMARSLLYNDDEAEDVVQETLVSVWRMHSRGRVQNLNSYANRAVWINSIKHRGRIKRIAALGLDDISERVVSISIKDEPELTPWELEKAIQDLPAEQQAVIHLRFYCSLSFKEIGRSLSISMNTAASRLRYAIIGLRHAFNVNQRKEDKNGKG